jgi:hypothetical protein
MDMLQNMYSGFGPGLKRKIDMRFGTWKVRSLYRAKFTYNSSQGICKILIRFSGCAGGTKGARLEKGIKIFLWKRK